MDHSDLLAPISQCVFEGIDEDAVRAVPGIDARRDRYGVGIAANWDVVLEGNAKTFEVFAYNDEINVVEASTGDQRARGTNVGIEMEFFP